MQRFILRYYVWLNSLIHYADKQRFHLAGDSVKTPPLRRGRSHALKQIDFQLSEFVFAQKTLPSESYRDLDYRHPSVVF